MHVRVPICAWGVSILGVEEGEGGAKDATDGGSHGEVEELGDGNLQRMGRLKKVGFGFSATRRTL